MNSINLVELWLNDPDRPEVIRKLARKYPPKSFVKKDKETLFIVGYTESGKLVVSKTDPAKDYKTANDTKFLICTNCITN